MLTKEAFLKDLENRWHRSRGAVPVPAPYLAIHSALRPRGSPRVRDRVRFLYETALRPGTVAAIEVPRHWKPGQRSLWVSADVDK